MFYLLLTSFVIFLLIVGISIFQRYNNTRETTEKIETDPVREISDEEFETVISKGVSLIDFWAPWCGPCRTQMPVIKQIATEMKEEAGFYKINVDDHKKSAIKMKIKNIPNIIIFRDGEPIRQLIGAKPKHLIMKALDDTLKGK